MPQIRELGEADIAAAERLSAEAFGRPPNPNAAALPGARYLGSFVDGQLAAKLTLRDYHSHFHQTVVPTCGIGSVTVAAEHRGAGLVRQLLPYGLEIAREQGAVVSGLFPSATGIYRGFGYETITDEREMVVDTADLAAATGPGHLEVTVRRAEVDDAEEIRHCYDRWASQHHGALTRRGASFPADDQALLDGVTSVFLAVSGGEVVGYCSWQRGEGFGAGAELRIVDLVGTTADATVALMHTIGSFAVVAGQTRVRASGSDPTWWFRRAGQSDQGRPFAYQLSILDVEAALAVLPPPPVMATELTISVRGRHALASVPGRYRITADPSEGVAAARLADQAEQDELTFSPGGLAVWWSGATGLTELRLAGLVSGTDRHDAALDALVPRRPVRILDHY